MLKHWLIELIGHASGLSEPQLQQIEKALPRTRALIDLLKRAQPIIDQAHSLYIEAEPLIDQAMKEWQTVGPAAQILIDVISHHVDKGGSPAEAADAMRAALDGSIKSVAPDHWIDRAMSCVTVFQEKARRRRSRPRDGIVRLAAVQHDVEDCKSAG
jgi:hypothetical protein